ncbi:hypothetical protein F2P56_011069 [Juglans regia]|uniref:Uncharacterized protein n=2 Tax=Juglans regia TaxID=51240 RepID=A0A833XTZ8_JUGRE|nr:uncharacterized protein LOC109002638 [Juglans regia]KAF5470565.1 hypothetical protein F2P56_011069 [Juglans regia]
MKSFSGIGISLSLVFGCLLLAFVAELYYLLWWRKKRITSAEIEDDYGKYAKELFQFICWQRPSSLQNSDTRECVRDQDATGHEPDPELGSSKDFLLKTCGEESVEAELMRLHNLAGPPRFLFTIKEETREDLESDDRSRKGSRTRSLSELIMTVDTPFLTPLASPPVKAPPLNSLDSYHHHGFNPLFESSAEAELNRLRSSPPPTFKFLRDAEEKLYRRWKEEAEKKALQNSGSVQDSGASLPSDSTVATEEKEGSFLKFIAGNNEKRELHHNLSQYPSSSSQVLPLASSPTAFRPLEKAPMVY